MSWCVLKKTKALKANLPRPMLTQTVLFIGKKSDAIAYLEEAARKPENWSTELIEVNLSAKKYDNQKNTTSARPSQR